MSWSTSELRVRLAPLNRFKPSSKIFYWPFQGGTSFVDLLCFCSVLCLLCLCASVYMCFVVTCWERADLLALVCGVFCEFVTFPLVSWVRCGTWLYRFLIFAPLLTYIKFGSVLHNSLTYTTHIPFYIRLNLKEYHGLVCNMWMWHFLVLPNYFLQLAWFFYIHIAVFRFLPMVHNDKHAIYIMN